MSQAPSRRRRGAVVGLEPDAPVDSPAHGNGRAHHHPGANRNGGAEFVPPSGYLAKFVIPPAERYPELLTILDAMGKEDERYLWQQIVRGDFGSSNLAKRFHEGDAFSSVWGKMLCHPCISYLGGKQVWPGTPQYQAASRFMEYMGAAAGLIGMSGVAGNGSGIMSLTQQHHGLGKAARKALGFERLFQKSGVAGVTLVLNDEGVNPWTTHGWSVRLTRHLGLRTERIFSLGVPIAACFFEGGNATQGEFWYALTAANPGKRELIGPFTHMTPRFIFIDPADTDEYWRAVEAQMGEKIAPADRITYWEDLLCGFYRRQMLGFDPKRRERKKVELKDLVEGLVHIGHGAGDDTALSEVKRVWALIEQNAQTYYGVPFQQTWEEKNQAPFWPSVERAAALVRQRAKEGA